jgi:hypothetical protein
MKTRALAAVVLLALGGCSGKQGPAGADGRSVLLRTASEAAGTSCASGGVKVESGLDANANGVLDAGEVASTAYVCAGADGQSVVPSAENPGANCSAGGVALTPGAGSPFYVCNGAAGAAGDSVVVTPEPAGTACPYGGERFQVGSGAPTYACNGAPGAAGDGVAMTPEPAGVSCEFGGQRLQVGTGSPTYVCNGAPGATGAAGDSVAMTPEPAGANCEFGGQRLQVGTGSPTYVCNGSPGAAGASVAMTPEPAGANCEFGGQRLQVGSGAFAYVCNGAPGAPGESVTMTPEPAGSNCLFGGVRLQIGTGPVSYLCSGAPVGVTLPTVQTAPVTDVRYAAAQVDATVVDDGGEMVLVRGVVLATHSAPTIHDTVYLSGTGAGAFSTLCDGLLPATTYSARAFATNTLGTAYGDERSFTTRALTVPALGTLDASNVTNKTAISGGDVTDDGGTPILARGICWSTSPDPSLADACASEGAGAGSFLALATGLTPGTTYHVRAYATNAQGNSYGDDRSFTTVVLPLATVTTAAPSAVSYTTATGGGNVTSDNGAPVTSRGICWATSPAPTTSGSCYTEAGGTGSFTASITGLSASTKYYVRAFAVNGGGTSYGNEVSFTTLAVALPSLTTKAVTGVSSYIAGSGGTIATDGGSTITAKGVCWSLNPGPTIANGRTNDGTGPASFNSTLTGLVLLTTYYVRAYATNGLGTAYGNEISFTTTDLVGTGPTVPVLGTSPVAMSTSSTATSGGYVSNDGGSAVSARGLCWSTAQNPTLAGTCSTDGGTGVGFFTSTVTGLGGCGVVYYVRAYATNATGTGYGNQVTLSTGLAPTATTAPVTGIGYYTATSGGTVVDNGGCAITQKGVVWSLSQNPTTSSSKTTEGAGDASFVSSLTGLFANRTYYLRAYATNSAGTSYGPQLTFATAEPSTPYIGQSYGGGIVFYVDGTGLHGLIAAPSDQGLARWGCSGTSIPTGTALGTGPTNTAAIVASCGDSGIAAKVADNLVLNGYSDWFLPSKDELNLMLTNLSSMGLGGFGTSYPYYYYWTSSQYDGSNAYMAYANSGSSYYDGKTYNYNVRAVRAF